MCCFAGESKPYVANTRIFARTNAETSTLVYSMKLTVDADVAMILPLPVKPGTGEAALTFVNLEDYVTFFDDLQSGFPVPQARSASFGLPAERPASIVVHTVGAFEASFVPTVQDFAQLDPRFVLAADVWAQLPHYHDYGFAVFRLTPGNNKAIHPMALQFQTRFPGHIFFPTVHIHDGQVHTTANFDHTLFYQTQRDARSDELGTVISAKNFMKMEKTQGLVDLDKQVLQRLLHGKLPNSDFFVEL